MQLRRIGCTWLQRHRFDVPIASVLHPLPLYPLYPSSSPIFSCGLSVFSPGFGLSPAFLPRYTSSPSRTEMESKVFVSKNIFMAPPLRFDAALRARLHQRTSDRFCSEGFNASVVGARHLSDIKWQNDISGEFLRRLFISPYLPLPSFCTLPSVSVFLPLSLFLSICLCDWARIYKQVCLQN